MRKIITGDLSLRPIVTGRASIRPVVTASRVSMRPVVTGKVGAGPAITVGVVDGVLALPLPMVQFSAQGTVVTPSRVDGALGITLPMVQFSASGTVVTSGPSTITDSFDRADNATAMLNADTGEPWSTSGRFGIIGNLAYRSESGSGRQFETIDAGTNNFVYTITLTTMSVGDSSDLPFRYIDASNYLMLYSPSGGARILFKVVAGAFTTLGSFGTVASGDVMEITANDDSIEIRINGTLGIARTETANQAGTRVGIGTNGSGPSGTTRWNDLSVVPIAP